jgi:Tol biopolymer transport system component
MKHCLAHLFVLSGLALQAQNTDVLLQRGIQKETVDGDLKGAMELYKRAAKQAGNRASAAKALLRLAECYEKQGDQEARKTYEQITREFADQAEVVSVARTRLGGGAGARQVQVRKVWDGPLMGNSGTPSPDGRYLSFVHWATGNPALYDLATRQTRLLTNESDWLNYKGFSDRIVFSPDGKQVVYWWWGGGDGAGGQLRLQSVAGGPPRVIYESKDTSIGALAWLPAGTHILGAKGSRPKTLVLVPVAGGAVKELGISDLDHYTSGLSPDGRYLAVTRTSKPGDRNVSVVPLADGTPNGTEWPLISDLSDDILLGWAPSGNAVLFSSDRTGSTNAYLLPVKDGRAAGAPVSVRDNIGRVQAAGFDRTGRFYYHPNDTGGAYDVHIASVDPATGKLTGAPVKIPAARTGRHRDSVFSPDGKTIAYYRGRAVPQEWDLVFFDVATATESVIPGGSGPTGLVWLPNGTLLASSGAGKVTRVDREQKQFVDYPVSVQGTTAGSTRSCKAGTRIQRQGTKYELVSLLEGKKWEIRSDAITPSSEPALDISPDCRQLAWTDDARNALVVGPSAGGEARVLVRLPAGERIDRRLWSIRWTADGRHIFFKKYRSYDKPLEIWRVPASGGEAVFTGIAGDWLEHITVNADGSRIAWTGGRHNFEAWLMENFLGR